ncbi:MAG: phosphate-starvation-inducible PsiE family protein [Leptolyngbyaceae cyanobacterium MO_188.B28]|nr:phosphate-starvation-inducible PsiE family protein [Leptolyngbyaceae cyanobacterium MO_188.B28]
MLREKLEKVFDVIIEIVFGFILIFLVVGIAIGTIQMSTGIWELLSWRGVAGSYIDIISDVLTLYVLVELSRSLVEYFQYQKFRLTFIVDAGIVFVLREILIGLFKQELQPNMIYALSVLLLIMGLIRIGSVLVFQIEKNLSKKIQDMQ